MANPMIPLLLTVAVVGTGGAYYYYKMYCPDVMVRDDDGDCVCPDTHFLDPDDDQNCVALSTTEAPACTGTLVNGVYVYDKDGDALTTVLGDESKDVQIDCLLCKACSQDQADDGRCLRCQPAATQTTWRATDDVGEDELDHAAWITDYHDNNHGTTTPLPTYAWKVATEYESTSEAENYRAEHIVAPEHTPMDYKPTTGPLIRDASTEVSTYTGWGISRNHC